MLEVDQLVKHFPVKAGLFSTTRAWVQAVNGVSFKLGPEDSLALVGESGSGKTTIARCLVRLEEPTKGRIEFGGVELLTLKPQELKPWRRRIQYVFQDPYSALNPRMRIGRIVGEGLRAHSALTRAEVKNRVETLMAELGLAPDSLQKYPHEFSGGQRQRIAIARSLILDPELLILDEPVSALDVSVQAQILNLLAEISETRSLSTILITHNLAVVRQVSRRIAVLYLGRIIELGLTSEILDHPRHPYTRALISAVPELGKEIRVPLEGEVPSNITPPPGCPFHPRCPRFKPGVCDLELPPLVESEGRSLACLFPLD